jgi:hypothetical protein
MQPKHIATQFPKISNLIEVRTHRNVIKRTQEVTMPERSRREGQLFPLLCVISLHSLTGIFWILFVAGAPVGALVGAPAGASAGASAGAPVAFPDRTSVVWLPVITAPSPWRRKVELQQISRNLSDQSTRSKMRKTRQEFFAPLLYLLPLNKFHYFVSCIVLCFPIRIKEGNTLKLLRRIFSMYTFIFCLNLSLAFLLGGCWRKK